MKLSHTVGLLSNAYRGSVDIEDQDVTGFDSDVSRHCGALGDRSLCLCILAQAVNFGSRALLIGVDGGIHPH
jgi:hypothetical protein